jgi:hypothetical protein
MPTRPSQRTAHKRPTAAPARTKRTTAAGISNHPPIEEAQQQEQLPPRGQARKKIAGGKA